MLLLAISKLSRERLGVAEDALELGAHQVLAAGIVAPPAAEGRQQTGGDLRVARIERQHLVGDQGVAGAVGAMEAGRVALGEGADQRAHPVRVLQRERRVRRAAA